MKIPDNTLYPSRFRTYGNRDFTIDGVEEDAGCPRLFKLKYEQQAIREPEDSYPLLYGGMIHDALYIHEEHDLPLIPDALDKAVENLTMPLGPDAYDEAVHDLMKYMERGDDLATIAVEQHLTAPLMEIDGVQYLMGGYIDRIAIDPDDPKTIYVIDYKTNRAPAKQEEVDRNNQFTHYAALVRANLHKYLPGEDPLEVRIVTVWDAIKWKAVYSERPNWMLDQYLDWARAMTRRIVGDEEGAPVLNSGCNYCPVKYDCPAFTGLPGRGVTIADRMSATTNLEVRVALMQEAALIVKALNGAMDEVKKELKERVKDGKIVVNGIVYEGVDDFANEWNLPMLAEVLGKQFWNVVSVTGYKVDAITKREPELKLAVEACRERYPKETKRLKASRFEQ